MRRAGRISMVIGLLGKGRSQRGLARGLQAGEARLDSLFRLKCGRFWRRVEWRNGDHGLLRFRNFSRTEKLLCAEHRTAERRIVSRPRTVESGIALELSPHG